MAFAKTKVMKILQRALNSAAFIYIYLQTSRQHPSASECLLFDLTEMIASELSLLILLVPLNDLSAVCAGRVTDGVSHAHRAHNTPCGSDLFAGLLELCRRHRGITDPWPLLLAPHQPLDTSKVSHHPITGLRGLLPASRHKG